MNCLVVDTSRGFRAALYCSTDDTVTLLESSTLKLSEIFHQSLDNLIKIKLGDWSKLDHYLYNLGPGSYTGLKVAASLADILKLKKVKILGYHSFELPQLRNYPDGYWIDRAFKNEYFIHHWSNDHIEQYLLKMDDFVTFPSKKYFFSDDSLCDFVDGVNSDSFLWKNLKEMIPELIKRSHTDKDIFYYRTIDQEFSKS